MVEPIQQQRKYEILPNISKNETMKNNNTCSTNWNTCTGSFTNTITTGSSCYDDDEKMCCTEQHTICNDIVTEHCDTIVGSNEHDNDKYDDDDDDVSILEQGQEHPSSNQRQQLTTPYRYGVRNIMDGFFAPIMNCVQPQFEKCIAPTTTTTSVVVEESEPVSWMHHQQRNQYQYRISRTNSMTNHHGMVPNQNTINHSLERQQRRSNNNNNSIKRTESKTPLVLVPSSSSSSSHHININDVLCGRGNSINQHSGNIHFRELILANQMVYRTLTKKEKIIMAQQIVNIILYHTNPPGRFVSRDTTTGLWSDIGLSRSLEKTSQALREKSITSTTTTNMVMDQVICGNSRTCVSSIMSFDETIPDAVEVHVTDSTTTPTTTGNDTSTVDQESAQMFSRATTIKVRNVRNIPIEPPKVHIPDHLCTTYHQDPVTSIDGSILSKLHHHHGPPISSRTATTTQWDVNRRQSESIQHCQRHTTPRCTNPYRQRLVPSSLPVNVVPNKVTYLSTVYDKNTHGQGTIHGNLEMNRNNYVTPSPVHVPVDCHTASVIPTTLVESPPRPLIQRHPIMAKSAALVTPIGQYTNDNNYCVAHQGSNVTFTSPQHIVPSHNNMLSSMKSQQDQTKAVAMDVFKSPFFFDDEMKSTISQTTGIQHAIHNVSPSRTQNYSKRQRMTDENNNNLIDVSFDVTCIELDTSWETVEPNMSSNNNNNNQDQFYTATTIPNLDNDDDHMGGTAMIVPSHHEHLVDAIGMQLSLEEKVIRSPTEMIQSYAGGARRRVVPLPRPSKMTGTLDTSADSMDGLAALSTTAFLCLDESF